VKTRSAKPSGEGTLSSAKSVRVVFLVGFMGAGKTSVGKALAEILGWKFEDLDDRIVAQERRSIAQIFSQSGEAGFRLTERKALESVLKDLTSTALVVALGGGAFVSPENVGLLGKPGLVTIFLDAPVEELFRRCEDQKFERPLRGSYDDFRNLHTQRESAYRRASLTVETSGKQVHEIANEIARTLELG